jgi:sugar/nucleoside kinase (ribokinase family)
MEKKTRAPRAAQAGPPKKSIVACGHLCLDIIPEFPAGVPSPRTSSAAGVHDFFRPGRLSVVGAPVVATGGAVSNVGLSLHRLGLPSHLVAKVGSDPLGRIVLERVASLGAGLTKGITAVEGETTSYSVVLSPPGVDRIFLHCPGANDTFVDTDVADSSLQGAAIFHFGYPPLMEKFWSDGGRRLARLLRRARQQGAITSLDMSLPDPASPSGRVDWDGLLARVLPQVDIFVPSVEELLYMMDRRAFDRLAAGGGGEAIIRNVGFAQLSEVARKAIGRGARAVMIKLGDRGAYLRTGEGLPGLDGWENREMFTPVFSVPKVAGTTGAGDSTIAGFLASVFKGLPPWQALTMAVAVGACCVEAPDATSGIHSWAETVKRVEKGWRRAAVVVPEAGWARGENGVWRGPGDSRR